MGPTTSGSSAVGLSTDHNNNDYLSVPYAPDESTQSMEMTDDSTQRGEKRRESREKEKKRKENEKEERRRGEERRGEKRRLVGWREREKKAPGGE